MKKVVRLGFCMLAAWALAMSPAEAGDKVDNPEYKHWTKFKPGSYSVLQTLTTFVGRTTEAKVTETLKEITAEKVVLEVKKVMVIGGRDKEIRRETRDIAAKIDKAEAKKQKDPEGKVKEGREELTLCGKKLQTKWVETKTKEGDVEITKRTWTSDQIPGRIVKVATRGVGPLTLSGDRVLLEFKVVKK